jgi:L-alanine-DL-glutamate epimerase-like enolase superfamily enzyme
VRIVRVVAYRLDEPFREGEYGVSTGPPARSFDATVVALHTDGGLAGFGEAAPLGTTYDAAFAAGARVALEQLAPALLGEDPLQVERIGRAMDAALKGHPYAKSAPDMACWDLAGKATARPLCELLGGRFGESVDLYRSVPSGEPGAMAEAAAAFVGAGYRRIQVKVGNDPVDDVARVAAVRQAVGPEVVLFADANGGWSIRDARRFLLLLEDRALTIEQPCATLTECTALRPHCRHPLVLDESIDSLEALLRAHAARVADGITIKLARVGGITRARLIRDVAVALRIPVTVEDTGGSDIDTAATVHLSLSTPEALRLHTVDFANWVTVSNAEGLPAVREGRLAAPEGAGLGVVPRLDVLGEPFLDVAL